MRDRRKIEACPFNTDIPCRKATLVMDLTRSIRFRDRRDPSLRWVKANGTRYVITSTCEACAYNPEKVEEIAPAAEVVEEITVEGEEGIGATVHSIRLSEADIAGYRTLYEAAKLVHSEEVPDEVIDALEEEADGDEEVKYPLAWARGGVTR